MTPRADVSNFLLTLFSYIVAPLQSVGISIILLIKSLLAWTWALVSSLPCTWTGHSRLIARLCGFIGVHDIYGIFDPIHLDDLLVKLSRPFQSIALAWLSPSSYLYRFRAIFPVFSAKLLSQARLICVFVFNKIKWLQVDMRCIEVISLTARITLCITEFRWFPL